MNYDKYSNKDEFFYEEGSMNKGSLRQDHELYHDEDNLVHNIIQVKRVEVGTGEDWNIVKDKKIIVSIRGHQLNIREKKFMRQPQGIVHLMNAYKSGITTMTGLKKSIKKAAK